MPAHLLQCACTGRSWLARARPHTQLKQLQPLQPPLAVPSAWHACTMVFCHTNQGQVHHKFATCADQVAVEVELPSLSHPA